LGYSAGWLQKVKARFIDDTRHHQRIAKILVETDRIMRTIEMALWGSGIPAFAGMTGGGWSLGGYRLRVGDWRVIHELQDERLVMLVLEVGPRGGIC
jgi:hypothetical protein